MVTTISIIKYCITGENKKTYLVSQEVSNLIKLIEFNEILRIFVINLLFFA